MTSVFSSIPWRSKERSSSERNLTPPEPTIPSQDRPDLRDLNHALQALVDVFPDVQPEVFREMLMQFGEESRLQVVTEAMLRNGAKFIMGRYRTPATEHQEAETSKTPKYKYKKTEKKDTRGVPLAIEDKFRSKSYRETVKNQLYQEFKSLSRSTINAVLAEHNYSYIHARPTLLVLNSQSWRYSLAKIFRRRKQSSEDNHPLIEWVSDWKHGGPAVPRLRTTRNSELDLELHHHLIAPVLAAHKAEQLSKDHELALKLNEEEAEAVGEMYDCECCFIPNIMQQMAACDSGGHFICFTCIRHSVNEALYGQGWARNIDMERSTMCCIAPGRNECQGRISSRALELALMSSKEGSETYQKLEERFMTESLLKSQLPLIQCPFCAYAEIDTIALASPPIPIKFKSPTLLLVSVFSLANLYSTLIRALFLFLFFFINLNYLLLPTPLPLLAPFSSALIRLARKRHGLRFTCLSPSCGRSCCISCSAEWHPNFLHTCHETSLVSLRTTVERAMADAVKRTCPQCHVAFVKDSGCNKMRCPCGYVMCYVCRQRIGSEGYAHFCQHFRRNPGAACAECDRCDLYRTEDEDVLVRRAGEEAERLWLEERQTREGPKGKGKEKIGSGVMALRDAAAKRGVDHLRTRGMMVLRRDVWEGWLDTILDAILA